MISRNDDVRFYLSKFYTDIIIRLWNQICLVSRFKLIRRWLGLRKTAQVKTPSGALYQATTIADKSVPLKKVPLEKKLKLPYANDNNCADGEEVAAGSLDETEDDVPDIELPPPMKPIQDQHGGVTCGTNASGDVVEGTRSKENEEKQPVTPGPDSSEAVLKKCEYVLHELAETEEAYVADLQLICEGYMRHMQDPNAVPPLPEGLRNRRYRMIFGNVEAIYDWHREFLRELRTCTEAPELLGSLFRRFLEKKMFLYETYCRNKPVSEYIVSEHDHYFQELRQKLGHKLQLGDLLIKPIQRIQKYHLLVKKVLGYSESANAPPDLIAALQDAVQCTSIIPKNANDMMDVGRLQGFTGNITAQGKLLLQEPLVVTDVSSGSEKGKELHVFLFEQCVIFSEVVGKKTQFTSPTYHYRAHVQVNKMDLKEADSTGAFVIHSVDPNKPKQSFMCRAPEARRQQWISMLSSILQSQRMFGEALENPGAYLRELHREPAS